MEDLVERLSRGNVTEVKVVLASVALALGVYQLVLIAVDYRKLRLPFLAANVSGAAHRSSGDSIVVLLLVVGVMCVSYFGVEDEAILHSVVSTAPARGPGDQDPRFAPVEVGGSLPSASGTDGLRPAGGSAGGTRGAGTPLTGPPPPIGF